MPSFPVLAVVITTALVLSLSFLAWCFCRARADAERAAERMHEPPTETAWDMP